MSLLKLCTVTVRTRYISSASVARMSVANAAYFNKNTVNCAKFTKEKKADLARAVNEAEKIVGFSTSPLSLQWLTSDDTVSMDLKELSNSSHPLLKTVRFLIHKNAMQPWGLIVLLISKSAGYSAAIPEMEQGKVAGILHSQRTLAEVTAMLKLNNLIRNCNDLVNMQSPAANASGDATLERKMVVLSGNYLLAKSWKKIAQLRNPDLLELMSLAVRDLTEAGFVGHRDRQNYPLPARPRPDIVEYNQFPNKNLEPQVVSEALGHARPEWTLRQMLNGGNLLSKFCQGTLKLAGHPIELQEQGYLFGKHLALAWQASLDREPFFSETSKPFSLVGAPVMFTLQHDPSLYKEIEKGQENVDDVDYEAVRKAVLVGPGLEATKKLQTEHSTAALEILNQLPPSDARTALVNITAAVQAL